MSQERIVRLRGHHLTSVEGYVVYRDKGWGTDPVKDSENLGYGDGYVSAKREIFERLYQGHEGTVVEIVDGLDDLCQGGCQSKYRNKEVCQGSAGQRSDESIAKLWGFQVGEIYPAKELINAIRKKRGCGRLI